MLARKRKAANGSGSSGVAEPERVKLRDAHADALVELATAETEATLANEALAKLRPIAAELRTQEYPSLADVAAFNRTSAAATDRAHAAHAAVSSARAKQAEAMRQLKQDAFAHMRPDRDAAVLRAEARGAELSTRFKTAGSAIEALGRERSAAEGTVRAARLKLAEGAGSDAELAKAKRELEAIEDKLAGARDLREAIGVQVADAHAERTRELEAAGERTRAAILKRAAKLAGTIEEHAAPIVAAVEEASRLLAFVESLAPIGQRGPLFALPEELRFVLARSPLVAHFREDPYSTGGGAYQHWRARAAALGLLNGAAAK